MSDVRLNVPPRLIESARAAQYANRESLGSRELEERIKKRTKIKAVQERKKNPLAQQEREGGQLEFERKENYKIWTRRRQNETPGWLLVPSDDYINNYYLRVISNFAGETTSCSSLVAPAVEQDYEGESRFQVEYGQNCTFLSGQGPNNSNLLELQNVRFTGPVPLRNGSVTNYSNLVTCSFGTFPLRSFSNLNQLPTPPSTAETIEFILRIGRKDGFYTPFGSNFNSNYEQYKSSFHFLAYYGPTDRTGAYDIGGLKSFTGAAFVRIGIYNEVRYNEYVESESWQPKWELFSLILEDDGASFPYTLHDQVLEDIKEGDFCHFAILQKENNIRVFLKGQLISSMQLTYFLPRDDWSWELYVSGYCYRDTYEKYDGTDFRLTYPTNAGRCAIHGLRYTGDVFYDIDSFTPPESITSLV